MIPRFLAAELRQQLAEFPLVTVLGPRQAGKTTLARSTLPDFTYLSLEDPDTRRFAIEDPRAFLKTYPGRAIFDEIQRTPELLSYLQGHVDAQGSTGQYVLTGSHQLELRHAVSQSLAGRTGILHLLPLSLAELQANGEAPLPFAEACFRGFLPAVVDNEQRPTIAYASYYQTYVERDVRQLTQVKDSLLFEKFIKLLAGRVGQLVNHASLASDVGVDSKTIANWLSILEASFLIFRVPPHFENFGKRLIKSPKIYFTDTGLLAYLLGVESKEQLTRDPLVGQMFENLVVLELLKARYNQGLPGGLAFFRDSHGHEIDLLLRKRGALVGVEIKSAQTYNASFRAALDWFNETVSPLSERYVVYAGEERRQSDGTQVLSFSRAGAIFDSEPE